MANKIYYSGSLVTTTMNGQINELQRQRSEIQINLFATTTAINIITKIWRCRRYGDAYAHTYIKFRDPDFEFFPLHLDLVWASNIRENSFLSTRNERVVGSWLGSARSVTYNFDNKQYNGKWKLLVYWVISLSVILNSPSLSTTKRLVGALLMRDSAK